MIVKSHIDVTHRFNGMSYTEKEIHNAEIIEATLDLVGWEEYTLSH